MSNKMDSLNVVGRGIVSAVYYTKNPVTAVAGRNVVSGKPSKFGGKFDQVTLGMYITKVLYNDPATIVFWSDGTKTMSKSQHGDAYCKETGLALCVLKKLVGGDQVAKLLTDWVVDENIVDLKLVRNKEKEAKTSVVELPEITYPVVKKKTRNKVCRKNND